MHSGKLSVPCCYQGGKQRIAAEIVDRMVLSRPELANGDVRFYDLCCGSGAISIELINRGVPPETITMVDASSWGAFWKAIGEGSFDLEWLSRLLAEVPDDKSLVKDYASELSKRKVGRHEAEIYPVLQACSFGGKQIWYQDGEWRNAFFRGYWKPKPTSVRKSPANTMQPGPKVLLGRIRRLAEECKGLCALRADIHTILDLELEEDAVVYVDPPYQGSTGYAYGFDLNQFIKIFRKTFNNALFVSEGMPLTPQSEQLEFKGAKGGISGIKRGKHEEWLTMFA